MAMFQYDRYLAGYPAVPRANSALLKDHDTRSQSKALTLYLRCSTFSKDMT